MMVGVVHSSGIAKEDVEDVAMDILARFIEKDGIAYYDPNHLHDVGENPDLPGARFRKAKFKGMLRGFTATYVMQYRDKQMIRHRREPWRLDLPVKAGEHMEPWGEVNILPDQSTMADTEVAVSIIHALQQARKSLDEKTTEKRDYGRFLDLALQHGILEGKIHRKTLQMELGVSASTLNAMIKEVRATLRPMLTEVGVVEEAEAS